MFFILNPIEDDEGNLFIAKKWKRYKQKPKFIEFHLNGIKISGYFELVQYRDYIMYYDDITDTNISQPLIYNLKEK